jgi:hypothetical protein
MFKMAVDSTDTPSRYPVWPLEGGLSAGLPQDWGAGRDRRLRVYIVCRAEFLSEAGAERTIVDGAANLEQEIGTSSRPAHLVRLVHPAVHEKMGRPFADRGANPQSG